MFNFEIFSETPRLLDQRDLLLFWSVDYFASNNPVELRCVNCPCMTASLGKQLASAPRVLVLQLKHVVWGPSRRFFCWCSKILFYTEITSYHFLRFIFVVWMWRPARVSRFIYNLLLSGFGELFEPGDNVCVVYLSHDGGSYWRVWWHPFQVNSLGLRLYN